MPIPVDKLREAPPAPSDQNVAFLSQNKANAYLITEIVVGVEAYKREEPAERNDKFGRDLLQMFLDILLETERRFRGEFLIVEAEIGCLADAPNNARLVLDVSACKWEE